MAKQTVRELIGNLPKESGFRARMRFHQSWWRAFVLAEGQGYHPVRKNEFIGSTILQGEISGDNFLSENIRLAVKDTIQERHKHGSGIIEQDRLFNNLLSSQPLCFNFFGEMKIDKGFALQVLKRFYSELTSVERVIFEYAPRENYTNDNSAFDVAFEVREGDDLGLIGFECKYTDNFSRREFDRTEYRTIFQQSKIFSASYDQFISSRYNQLFRNQLIAEALLQNEKYNFVSTGLFCHPDDKHAIAIGYEFQEMLRDSNVFRVITYQDYIEEVQQLPFDWEKRELIMLLWARYCASQFSEKVYEKKSAN